MQKRTKKDLIIIIIYTGLFYIISRYMELFESFHDFSARHEHWELDEILITLSFASLLLIFFAVRRYREMKIENLSRLETEKRLRDARDKLEEQVDRRTEELITTNKQMKHTIDALQTTKLEKSSLEQQVIQSQKLESIGVLASGVAHDFNNLLTAINGYTDLIMIKTAGYGKDIHENLDKIRNAGKKASNLTKQLLAFSRKQVFDLKPVDINALINDIVNMASRLIGETIDVNVELAPDTCRANADKTQVEQVIMNLLINARDAMPEGGKLTISTSNTTFDDDYAKRHEGIIPGEYILISVSDTGTGMSTDVQEKIFDPFFTTKEAGKGTGLGLATAYGIVKQHKGNIWVYSEEGIGTTLKVYLPAIQSPEVEDCQEDIRKTTAGTEKILIVDDDEIVREFVSDTLEFHNYPVTVATNGKEALQKINDTDKPFDLILTDVIMPHMNGWELYEEILKLAPSAKVLFMSGYDDQKIQKDKIEQDPNLSFIAKPLTTSTLLNEMRRLLDA